MRGPIALAALALLSGCSEANGNVSDDLAGSKSFALANFDEVVLRGSDAVEVVSGPRFSVIARGSQAALDALEIEVDGKALKIGRKSREGMRWDWSAADRKSATVTVTLPVITAATVAGSGDMKVDNTSASHFSAKIAGSGDLEVGDVKSAELDLDVAGSGNLSIRNSALGRLSVTVAGSGDASIAGTARDAEIRLMGSGDISAANLTAASTDIKLMGSGDIALRANETANISIMGSGDVDITGSARCTISKRGSGEVRCQP